MNFAFSDGDFVLIQLSLDTTLAVSFHPPLFLEVSGEDTFDEEERKDKVNGPPCWNFNILFCYMFDMI